MYLEEIPALKLSLKVAKSDCIKLVPKFIFYCFRSRQNRESVFKCDGFKFKIDNADFKAKLNDVLEKFNKFELIQIAKFLQTEMKETEWDNCT